MTRWSGSDRGVGRLELGLDILGALYPQRLASTRPGGQGRMAARDNGSLPLFIWEVMSLPASRGRPFSMPVKNALHVLMSHELCLASAVRGRRTPGGTEPRDGGLGWQGLPPDGVLVPPPGWGGGASAVHAGVCMVGALLMAGTRLVPPIFVVGVSSALPCDFPHSSACLPESLGRFLHCRKWCIMRMHFVSGRSALLSKKLPCGQ